MTAPAPHRRSRLILIVLYLAVAILIGRASVEQNTSPFSLDSYIQGAAGMPYQARYLMVPVLRWAAQSHLMARLATALHNSTRSPMEVFLQILNSICLIATGALTLRLRAHLRPTALFAWLAPWLLLWIVAITYVVRYDQRLFLPYDFPALFLFNLGLLACFERRLVLLFLVLLAGTYNRETTVFLLPLWLALHWKQSPKQALTVTAGGVVLWVLIKLHLQRLVHQTSPGLQFNWNWNLAAIAFPHHWAQLLSVGGYLALPMWLNRRLIADRTLRLAWLGAAPFLLANLVFGVWNETRIFLELSVLVAVTASLQFEQLMRQSAPELTLDTSLITSNL